MRRSACTASALRRDSGGAGGIAAGSALSRNTSCSPTTCLTHRGERHVTAARGSQGGGPGAMSRAAHPPRGRAHRGDPVESQHHVSRGDRLIVETAGGGGFGDAAARAPERVAADIANGKVSREAAAALYRASLDD